jgi:hypothetical protein
VPRHRATRVRALLDEYSAAIVDKDDGGDGGARMTWLNSNGRFVSSTQLTSPTGHSTQINRRAALSKTQLSRSAVH